ncbi:RM54-like protein [Mya arenaria]|uniref:Large ribosomal subunit protein mL54 n=1 Tax=Mya arenaria TaxID=6604 RepID=A0ABY7DZQ7_MYAAR|nr:RM54-like protein [Mya arenaria]
MLVCNEHGRRNGRLVGLVIVHVPVIVQGAVSDVGTDWCECVLLILGGRTRVAGKLQLFDLVLELRYLFYHNTLLEVLCGRASTEDLSGALPSMHNPHLFKAGLGGGNKGEMCQPHPGWVGAPSKSGKKFEVETDADVLCTRLCGGNIYKEGEDPVLGKDEDYPEWLWKLKTERTFVPLEELDEEDPLYWRRLRKLAFRNNNKLKAKIMGKNGRLVALRTAFHLDVTCIQSSCVMTPSNSPQISPCVTSELNTINLNVIHNLFTKLHDWGLGLFPESPRLDIDAIRALDTETCLHPES